MRNTLFDKNRKTILDNGKVVYTRDYHFINKKGKHIVIQDHSAGHDFGSKGSQGSHFNVREKISLSKHQKELISVDNTYDHYLFPNSGE